MRVVSLAASFDKVAKVIAAAVEFLDDIKLLVIRDAVRVRALYEVPFRAIEDDTDLVPLGRIEQSVQLFVIRVVDTQTTGFQHDALLAIVVN